MTALRPTLALFTRALREDNRAKFPTILRTIAILFVLLLVWINQSDFVNQTAPGLQLLAMVAMVNFFGLTITGLGTFCSSITEEKEDETLGLIRMTRLNPLAILLGKSTARLTSGLLFLSVQLPFTMLCATLGGVSFKQILEVYAILAAYLFFLCNLGLFWSVLSRTTSRAISFTTTTLAILYILAPVLYFASGAIRSVASYAQPDPVQVLLAHLFSFNPFFHLLGTVVPFGGFGARLESILPSLIGGTVCFLAAWAFFDRFCTETQAAPARRPKRGTGRTNLARPWRLAVAWKDFHFYSGGWKGACIRTVLYGAIVFGIAIFANAVNTFLSVADLGKIIATTAFIIFSVEYGVAASRIFGIERKRKTLGTLWVLPQTTFRLIRQKILGTLPSFIPALLYYALGTIIYELSRVPEPANFRTFSAGPTWAFSISQYVFFGVFVTYLSLRMRKGALLLGILTMFLGNIIAQFMVMRFVLNSGMWANNDWETNINRYYLYLSLAVTTAAIILASLIPRRIAHCAAED